MAKPEIVRTTEHNCLQLVTRGGEMRLEYSSVDEEGVETIEPIASNEGVVPVLEAMLEHARAWTPPPQPAAAVPPARTGPTK